LPQCGPATRTRALRDARSDAALLAAVRRKDERAFNVLYERYFRRIHSFAFARLRNRADAEEVVQETFTAVFKSIDAFRGQSSLLAWIYGIAKNTINSQLRRNKLQDERLERAASILLRPADSIDACTPEERLSLRRCSDAVEESLASVSDWQAEVFAMRHLEDLSIQEIADRMSRSNDAIRSSLYRVKRLVVETIQAEQVGAV
jgi:RNA polymerase sigma-70 factor, ECF subfamily